MGTPSRLYPFLILTVLSIALLLINCTAVKREEGLQRSPEARKEIDGEVATGVVAGKVTDRITGAGIADVAVTFEPEVDKMRLSTDLHPIMDKIHLSTDSTGFYYAKIPVGPYRLRFSKDRYRSAEEKVLAGAGRKVTGDAALESTARVSVYAGKDVTDGAPGSRVSLKAAVFLLDGSTLKSINWRVREQDGRVPVVISEKRETGATVVLPGAAAYKKVLLDRLRKGGRLLNRWMVVGLGPSDLKEAGTATLEVIVTTSSGTYSDTADIVADLSAFAVVNPGLQNVPIGEPVLLQGKDQASYAWTLTGPIGSAVSLRDTTTQTPHFMPDVPGVYTLAEGNKARLKIYAGTWSGAVVVKSAINRPWIARKGCACHINDRITPKFDASWVSGHSEIFTYNITTSYRYEESCLACHSLGFRKAASGGIKDDPAYSAFLNDATLWDLGKTPPVSKPATGHWDYIVKTYPGIARLTNVQCENCHGPNNSEAHKTLKVTGAPERISLSADACGTCHDESADVSTKQWRASSHSNYHLAMELATVEKRGDGAKNCGRCHAGQGFLAWTAQRKRTKEIQSKGGDASLAGLSAFGLMNEKVHPLTCVICHDSHDSGNSFRSGTEKVPVRISGDGNMHPVEFGGNIGGRGALCITCHSTDSGPHNDRAIPVVKDDEAPHAAQSDVLLGQNAFFVEVGKNKSHSQIEDTCIWCHMKPVPKRSAFGYPRGGVNHTFKTSPGLCSRCHKEFEGEELMASMGKDLERLKTAIQGAMITYINRKLNVRLLKAGKGTTDVILNASDIRKLELLELRGDMVVKVSTGQSVYEVPLSQVHPGGVPFLPTGNGQVIAKAAWNYLLLKSDASRGAHNPQFVSEILEATAAKLTSLKF